MQLIEIVKNLGLYRLSSICLGIIVLFSSCSEDKTAKKTVTERVDVSIIDDHSYANLNKIKTKHLHLDLEVNFKNKIIYGVARHQMQNKGTTSVIFDTKGLLIQKVTLGEKGKEKETDFVIGKMDKDSLLGQPLIVSIQKNTEYVNIHYQTTEKSDALEWLDPVMTSSKKHPFLYTQGEAILTRTWIPLQDTPSNRFTYSADVKVDTNLMALMSAVNPVKKNNQGHYHFSMNEPISSYLIALTVGDIAYHPYTKNCGVYAEKELLKQVAYEFVDLPKMMTAAEKLYGKYQWGKYDVLVLPYSFPFGGMENPRLTFANPTLITGDRSLVSVIAHELAHSWSGNLVTNGTWNDFWLNEGFTVYFEERIMEEIYGRETADILSEIEFFELEQEMKEIKSGEHPEDTKLLLALKGRDPDDGMTSVAYVKGAFFLKTLEQKVGREKLDVFLKKYFEKFKFSTITTQTFEEFLNKELLEPNDFSFNTHSWIYEEGLPKNCYKIKSKRLDAMRDLALKANSGASVFKPKLTYKYVKVKGKKKKKRVPVTIQIERNQFMVQEWQTFIRNLSPKVSIEQLDEMDHYMHFSTCGNSELMYEWYLLNIREGNRSIRPEMKAFLEKVGRRKYILPIYKALSKNKEDKQWAKEVFAKAKDQYHAVSKNSIEKALQD